MAESVYRLQIPQGYTPALDILETEKAIKILKDAFEAELAQALHLTRVSAPLFVLPETGLNDNLNGVERPVSFDIRYQGGQVAEIVHSLAKWKRFALQRYGFAPGSGLYTDMNAVRRDEITDNVHSLYVDQWDWERAITADRRTPDFLKHIVRKIYGVFLRTQERIRECYPQLAAMLPGEVTFLTTQELEDRWPALSAADRETAAVKEHGAVFLMGIGGKLRSGAPHDGRAPDYDDCANGIGLLDIVENRLVGAGLRRLGPERRPAVLLSRARPGAGAILHGHPGGRRLSRRPAERSGMRGPRRPPLPEGAAGGRASPHHRRGNRAVPAVHVLPSKSPYWRGAGFHLAGRDAPRMRAGGYPAAVERTGNQVSVDGKTGWLFTAIPFLTPPVPAPARRSRPSPCSST